jgi:hypothetical protein
MLLLLACIREPKLSYESNPAADTFDTSTDTADTSPDDTSTPDREVSEGENPNLHYLPCTLP